MKKQLSRCAKCQRARWEGKPCKKCDLNVVDKQELQEDIRTRERRICEAKKYPQNTRQYRIDLEADEEELQRLKERLAKIKHF